MRNLVLLCSTVAAGFVLLGFALFVVDELSAGSRATIVRLETGSRPAPSGRAERDRERASGGLRETIADVNDVLLAPFAGVTAASESTWARRGVPTLLGLLAYGLLLRMLAGYLPAARGPQPQGWEVPR